MPRPLPNPADAEAAAAELEKLGRAWAGEQWAGPFCRELVARGVLKTSSSNARTTLMRWLKRKRVAPKDVLDLARNLGREADIWINGQGDSGSQYLVRRISPRFVATVEGRDLGRIEWLDAQPAAPTIGAVVRDAEAYLRKRAG